MNITDLNQKIAQLENEDTSFSPATNWTHGGLLIEKYQIDLRYNAPSKYSKPGEIWLGGLFIGHDNVQKYVTAWAEEPLVAAMIALAKAYYNEDLS